MFTIFHNKSQIRHLMKASEHLQRLLANSREAAERGFCILLGGAKSLRKTTAGTISAIVSSQKVIEIT